MGMARIKMDLSRDRVEEEGKWPLFSRLLPIDENSPLTGQ